MEKYYEATTISKWQWKKKEEKWREKEGRVYTNLLLCLWVSTRWTAIYTYKSHIARTHYGINALNQNGNCSDEEID